jgi:hypothetical protein
MRRSTEDVGARRRFKATMPREREAPPLTA